MQVGTATSEDNPTHSYFNSRGMWVTYVLLIFIAHLIILSIPYMTVALAWTLTVTAHNLIMYILLHWEKGSPYETMDQGKSRVLTQWEQFDDGIQYSPTKKFLLIVPVILFILASFYTKYQLAHFIVNVSTLVFLGILPKLPQFYRVRMFGINKW